MYSSPTIVDVDHDGKLEIIVGTSVGFVYVLNSQGSVLPGWPVQMGEVQAQVAVADVDGDSYLELAAVDTRGNVALFDREGKLRWDIHVRSPIAQPVTFGDIDGDGRLEAVFGAASGEVYALDALTGACLMLAVSLAPPRVRCTPHRCAHLPACCAYPWVKCMPHTQLRVCGGPLLVTRGLRLQARLWTASPSRHQARSWRRSPSHASWTAQRSSSLFLALMASSMSSMASPFVPVLCCPFYPDEYRLQPC